MNSSVRKQLDRYRRMYRRHLMMQKLKGAVRCGDKSTIACVALLGVFVAILCITLAAIHFAPWEASE